MLSSSLINLNLQLLKYFINSSYTLIYKARMSIYFLKFKSVLYFMLRKYLYNK
jgi:hypothetical protein